MRRLIILFTLLILATGSTTAQDVDTGVWVTTQDLSVLREGPSTLFDRLTVVPPEVTLPAIGRTAGTDWIQVVYEGEIGWIASWLLVWTGDLIGLPVDGVETVRFAREIGVLAVTTRDTPYYDGLVTPINEVGIIPEETELELTGRLGSSGFYQIQVRYNGGLYWVGSWNLDILDGRITQLLDISYLYPYGRLVTQLDSDISNSTRRLDSIERIWQDIQNGVQVSCRRIPDFIDRRRTADADLRSEPIFTPLVEALDNAIGSTNTAISLFADACGRAEDEFFITTQEVRAAFDAIDEARRNYVLARSLLISLTNRNPILN